MKGRVKIKSGSPVTVRIEIKGLGPISKRRTIQFVGLDDAVHRLGQTKAKFPDRVRVTSIETICNRR